MARFTIIPYTEQYREVFSKLNRTWLEKYFYVEPIDELVLGDPETHILKDGGEILVALENELPVGVVALKKVEANVYEMTKMAVDESHQGKGYGEKLCKAAIDKAIETKVERLVLYSNTALKPAITLYKKLGWKEVSCTEDNYERCDIKMEYPLGK